MKSVETKIDTALRAFRRMQRDPSRRVVKHWMNTQAAHNRLCRASGQCPDAPKTGSILRRVDRMVIVARRVALR